MRRLKCCDGTLLHLNNPALLLLSCPVTPCPPPRHRTAAARMRGAAEGQVDGAVVAVGANRRACIARERRAAMGLACWMGRGHSDGDGEPLDSPFFNWGSQFAQSHFGVCSHACAPHICHRQNRLLDVDRLVCRASPHLVPVRCCPPLTPQFCTAPRTGATCTLSHSVVRNYFRAYFPAPGFVPRRRTSSAEDFLRSQTRPDRQQPTQCRRWRPPRPTAWQAWGRGWALGLRGRPLALNWTRGAAEGRPAGRRGRRQGGGGG